MYAVISDRHNQATVRVGDELVCDLMESDPGTEVTFEDVLLVGEEGQEVRVGKPTVEGARVVGEVLGEAKGKKVIVFRFKRRKNVRCKKGHRQRYTRVRITDISA